MSKTRVRGAPARSVSTAAGKYLRGSPTKFRLVANAVRGRSVTEALSVLQLTQKRAAAPLEKVLRSAIANAEDTDPAVDVDRLFVAEIRVDDGPTMPTRIRPQPMGRAYPIIKRMSHVTVRLAERGA